ncbi:hypothetical protein [Rathayibacter sp. VKM Ac-2927]|uniref:hypothetical protein n=1 Tax=Rathayibacter sp. VKM Ac-2927 TaxID=2929478 RepID=UPI001FB1AFDF|nr:hypothetical protein [Rathayibacter sp. VKM Ac-2927]MCJ1687667.1 hypothetical protein [Rathayibacter sp. VKM Ac-2927]
MLEARRHAAESAHTGVVLAAVLAAPALVALTALGGAALGTAFLRGVVTPPSRRAQDVRVLAVRPEVHEIELAASVDTAVRGGFSLWFDHGRGHARIGRLLAAGSCGSSGRSIAGRCGPVPAGG